MIDVNIDKWLSSDLYVIEFLIEFRQWPALHESSINNQAIHQKLRKAYQKWAWK